MSTSFVGVRASAPGKVILVGEHAVVHGTRALATVIDKRTSATIRPNTLHPDAVQLVFHHRAHPAAEVVSIAYTWPLASLQSITAHHLPLILPPPLLDNPEAEPVRDALDASHAAFTPLLTPSLTAFDRSRVVFLLLYCFLYRARAALTCELSSELPISAGLGSSASYCSALSAALYALTLPHPPPTPLSISALTTINVWAYEGERVLHGNPSGVDNTCIVYGGVILYRRHTPCSPLPRLSRERWLIVNTGQARDTKALVGAVGARLRGEPQRYRPIIERIDDLVTDFIALINVATPHPRSIAPQLAPLLRGSQVQLRQLGVSHPSIEQVVDVAERYGVAAKLTGAGGGGCVLCLLREEMVEDEVKAIRAEMEAHGFQCLEAEVGQAGVDVHPLEPLTIEGTE